VLGQSYGGFCAVHCLSAHPEGLREVFVTGGLPPAFTGEMIYPWMFEDYAALRPLREVAEILAREERWPVLYDRARLARNTVPAAAAIYAEDMYVPRAPSEETAAAIGGMKAWLTNQYDHNGLRADVAVFERLLALRHDRV
jgi:pimeloyl-ACP methyl ester carboxylesterase